MPDKFFEDIYKLFDEAFDNKLEYIEGLDKGTATILNNTRMAIWQLVDVQNKIAEKYQKDGKIAEEDYNFLLDTYDNYQKASDKYLEMQSQEGAALYGAAEFNEFNDYIETMKLPLKQYAEDIKKAGPNVNLTEVYKDKRWIQDLFADDPQREARKNEELVPFEIQDKSKVNTSTTEYVNTVKNIAEKYDEHIKAVTGSKDHPYEAMRIKQQFIKSVMLENKVDPKKIPFASLKLSQLHEVIEKPLKLDGLKDLSEGSIINKDFFESIAARLIDYTYMRGELEKTSIDKNTVDYIMAAYKKLKFTPENVGITPTELDKLQKTSEAMSIFTTISRKVDTELNLVDHKEDLSSLKFAIKKCEAIKAKILNNMKGNPMNPVEDSEIEEMIDGFADYATRTPRYDGDINENALVKMSIDFCKDLATVFPTIKPHYLEKEALFKDSTLNHFNKLYSALSKETDPTKMSHIFAQGRTLCHEGLIDESNFDKLYVMHLAKNKLFRMQELKAATEALAVIDNDDMLYGQGNRERMQGLDPKAKVEELHDAKLSKYDGSLHSVESRLDKAKQSKCLAKTILLASYFNKENEAYDEFVSAKNENSKKFTNGYNSKIAAAISGKRKEDVTTSDKVKAASASVLSGLTLGIVSSQTMYKGINATTKGLRRLWRYTPYHMAGKGIKKAWNWLTKPSKTGTKQTGLQKIGSVGKKLFGLTPAGFLANKLLGKKRVDAGLKKAAGIGKTLFGLTPAGFLANKLLGKKTDVKGDLKKVVNLSKNLVKASPVGKIAGKLMTLTKGGLKGGLSSLVSKTK